MSVKRIAGSTGFAAVVVLLLEAVPAYAAGGHGPTVPGADVLGIGLRTLSGKLREYGYAPREKDFAKAS